MMRKIIGMMAACVLIPSVFAANNTMPTNNQNQKTNSNAKLTSNTLSSPQIQTNVAAPDFTPAQVNAMHKIIHDYLVSNPQVLIEASQALQAQQMREAQQQAMSAISQNKEALFNDPLSPVIGSANANSILVEFFDYQCSHCKAMNQTVQAIVKSNPNLKIIFKELPIFGSDSQYAAKAALASVKQGKYYVFHDALLAAEGPLTNTAVMEIAKKVGLDLGQLKKDMASADITKELNANFQLAQQLKLMGTPSFVVANKQLTDFRFIPGATSQESLQQQINAVTAVTSTPAINQNTQVNANAHNAKNETP